MNAKYEDFRESNVTRDAQKPVFNYAEIMQNAATIVKGRSGSVESKSGNLLDMSADDIYAASQNQPGKYESNKSEKEGVKQGKAEEASSRIIGGCDAPAPLDLPQKRGVYLSGTDRDKDAIPSKADKNSEKQGIDLSESVRTRECLEEKPKEGLDKNVARGLDLLKSGKFEDLCKIARELDNGDDPDALGRFQKQLSKEAKMNISFIGAGKGLKISFDDRDPNARDQNVTTTSLRIKADGTLQSATEHVSGGFGGAGQERELDPKTVHKQIMEKLQKNISDKQ